VNRPLPLPQTAQAVPLAFYQQPPTRLFDINCHADFAGWAV
jgi:hypothetical protein